MKNPVYIGRIQHGDKTYAGQHHRIIEQNGAERRASCYVLSLYLNDLRLAGGAGGIRLYHITYCYITI
ncbi:hypothetical protein [Novosphingopyxis sp.]|uniref:hypothetical protein n=1 Tax=Novosphingopyxis sp. TaxID=2709690 RepID=UPI003B5CFDE5